jgi:hypothetical protein
MRFTLEKRKRYFQFLEDHLKTFRGSHRKHRLNQTQILDMMRMFQSSSGTCRCLRTEKHLSCQECFGDG